MADDEKLEKQGVVNVDAIGEVGKCDEVIAYGTVSHPNCLDCLKAIGGSCVKCKKLNLQLLQVHQIQEVVHVDVHEPHVHGEFVHATTEEQAKSPYFMQVVMDAVATSAFSFTEGKLLRHLRVGELVEILGGPVQVGEGPFRVRAKTLMDDRECWITQSNLDGTSIWLRPHYF